MTCEALSSEKRLNLTRYCSSLTPIRQPPHAKKTSLSADFFTFVDKTKSALTKKGER